MSGKAGFPLCEERVLVLPAAGQIWLHHHQGSWESYLESLCPHALSHTIGILVALIGLLEGLNLAECQLLSHLDSVFCSLKGLQHFIVSCDILRGKRSLWLKLVFWKMLIINYL